MSSVVEPEVIDDFDSLVDRARGLIRSGGRRLLGIVGPPGSGKSTLSDALADTLGDAVRVVPMDGFHLANTELDRLGRRGRKGAIDTFDVDGYLALLRRLRDPAEEVVYAPQFRRAIDEAIAGAIMIPRDVPLVITEGNYLLVDEGHWGAAGALLEETWYIDVDEEARLARLIRRHLNHGMSKAAARAMSLGSDQHNATLVAATRVRADARIQLDALRIPKRAGRR